MQKSQRELCRRYGDLFGVKNATSPDRKQGELRMRFCTLKQVEAWRAGFGGDLLGFGVTDPNLRP